jgi:hypothetical protein
MLPRFSQLMMRSFHHNGFYRRFCILLLKVTAGRADENRLTEGEKFSFTGADGLYLPFCHGGFAKRQYRMFVCGYFQ